MARFVGTSILKIDAENKLKGKALYAEDINLPGMLWLKVLRSSVARGRIERIDVNEALQLPGVEAVFTAKDIPGINRVGPRIKDEYVLCEKEVNYRGDPIVLVAATSENIAREATKLIQVEMEELPSVFGIAEAMDSGAPSIHEGGNFFKVRTVRRGDVEEALHSADVVISNTYRTHMVEHAYIEPEAAVADYLDGKLTVWTPSKYLHGDHDELAKILDLDPRELRLILSTVGGYFGGKSGVSPAYYCALATYFTKRPSKMVYAREESFISSTKRHPYFIEHSLGAMSDGRFIAVKVKILADTGAYASFGPSVISRAAVHATGPYEIPHVLVDAYCVYTNNPVCGAMRGFGTPQVAIAQEAQIDLLAEKLGMDPIDIRKQNYLRKGSYTATGQKLEHSVGVTETCDRVHQYMMQNGSRRWRYTDNRYLYGWGVASMMYGMGLTGIPNPAEVHFSCDKDGIINVFAGVTDGGQGAATALSQIAAESIGVPVEQIRFPGADTQFSSDSGTSTASRLTYIVGRAIFEGGKKLRVQLIQYAARMMDCDEQVIEFNHGIFSTAEEKTTSIALEDVLNDASRKGVTFKSVGECNPDTTTLDPETGQGIPYATYAFATQAALVKVDRDTGQVEVLKVIAAHDVGRAINPKAVEAQVEGGVVMGLGYGIMEEVVLDQGEILNPGFQEYLIPTSLDIPEITTLIVEDPEPSGPFGAKGVGEPALVPTAAAILNAVERATGCRFFDTPVTAEKVWKAIKEKQHHRYLG